MPNSVMEFLVENAEKKYISFHMPGHKGSSIYKELGYADFLEKIMDCDITEVIGADNLFKAEGIIAETANRYKKLYDVKKSYLLINGSSSGLISAILASVPRGGKLIMARNSHKSIFNALSIGDIQPIYAYSCMLEEYGITGAISPSHISDLLEQNPDASAVILPSPNYYGICSDIKAIAKEVHKHGKILIVDQAHGAHLKFFTKQEGPTSLQMPSCAEIQGADIVINSIHKTLCSFTGSAVLNVCSDRVNLFDLEDKLQIMQTSSPSYLLMASLDINADIMEKHRVELMEKWRENIEWAYEALSEIKGLDVVDCDGLDKTKINIAMNRLGLDGSQLEQLLLEKGIRAELVTGDILMLMTGIGNTKKDFQKLYTALCEIAETRGEVPNVNKRLTLGLNAFGAQCLCKIPKEKEMIPLEKGADRICASSIIPYPPGIPIVCPGEKLTQEMINYIQKIIEQKEKVIGVTTDSLICVGK